MLISNISHLFINAIRNSEKWRRKYRQKNCRLNNCLLFCIFLLLVCLFFNRTFLSKKPLLNQSNNRQHIDAFINQIRDIAILDQNPLTSDQLPKWLQQYRIIHLFNFYWLQNGAYHWHLQRMFDLRDSVTNLTKNFQQKISNLSNEIYTLDYLNDHPEYGVILDTAPDPIKPLFPSLPQTSIPLRKNCQSSARLNNLFPCQTKPKMSSILLNQSLITYALYDVTIDLFKHSTTIKINHYDEIIPLLEMRDPQIDVNTFIQQILPRLIRLLALVPQSAVILLPEMDNKTDISQYLDVLIERGLIHDKNRSIRYNSNEIYHANAMYFTTSPRSDLILLHRILIGNQPSVTPTLILIIRQNLDDDNYKRIVQTVDLIELPDNLHIYEYDEPLFDLKKLSSLFQQARLIIGMPSDLLSHIVWCHVNTDIIEIIQKTMTRDVYEISLQLQLNYWLVMTDEENRIDMIDLRNLMMKIFTYIET